MIDTDKYEGHTPAPWTIDVHKVGDEVSAIVIESDWTSLGNCVLAEVEVENKYSMKDAQLIADAPKLLAAYKRLREELKQTRESLWWCYDNYRFDGHPMIDVDWNFIGNLLGADMESEKND